MIMVMLSQPTPPVSELDARQLSIMFSQILSKSCLAAIPRLTNSMTACEDWQSQIPRQNRSAERLAWLSPPRSPELTIASKNEELVVVAQIVHYDIRVHRHNLLLWRQLGVFLELKVPDCS